MKDKNLESLEMEVDAQWFGEGAVYGDSEKKPGPSDSVEIKAPPGIQPGGDLLYDTSPSWKISVGIACLVLGLLISFLFKTYKKEGVTNTLYGSRKDMAMMVKYLQTERLKLQTDLTNVRRTLADFEDAASKGKDESSTLKKQLNTARQEAGITALRGPGVIIRLADSPVKPKLGDDPNYYIIHDIDLLAVTNELWASGAEAISINGQRIVMTSSIRCVGPTITVNAVRLSPPYIVKAIGPPQNLETGLRYTGGFMDSMSPNIDRGVEIRITRTEDVIVPPFRGSLVNRLARPYEGEVEDESSK